MKVYTVGEDDVTRAILQRIIHYCSQDIEIISELPARGGEINSKLEGFNKLSLSFPVILLADLDTEPCAPVLLKRLFPEGKIDRFVFNIAVDEAEAWLMADRQGFADYFAVDIAEIPYSKRTKQGGNRALIEMDFPIKSSLYLMMELIQKSQNADYKKQLTPKNRAKKGPEYNSCIVPFIQNRWNIEAAQKNSDSLKRMIKRISALKD